MTKTEYAQYLQSPHWKSTRLEAIETANHKCERCEIPRWLAEIAYDQDLNVHHLSYENLGAEEWDDLQALCRRCHEIEKFGRSGLREPKFAICEKCGVKHWNPYSSNCERCSDILEQEPCCQCGHFYTPNDDYMVCDFCRDVRLGNIGRIFHSFEQPVVGFKNISVGEFTLFNACIYYDGVDNILDILAKNEDIISLGLKIKEAKSKKIDSPEEEPPF